MDTELSTTERVELQRLEEALWLAESRFDRDFMEDVLAADFFEFGRSGRVHSRENCLPHDAGTINAVIPLPNLHIRLLTPDLAQVTYNSIVTFEGTIEKSRRSSIWSKRGENWQLRFHQGTPFNIE